MPPLQSSDEKLRVDSIHLHMGPLPPGGAALELRLDLVAHLLRSRLRLLLGPSLCSRYDTLTFRA